MKTRYALSLLGLAAGMTISDVAAESYSVTDLGTLSTTADNNGCGSGPTGINNQDQVVGNYAVAGPYGGYADGFFWDDGKMTRVGASVQSPKLSVAAINNQGHMIANLSAGCLPVIGDAIFQQLFVGRNNAMIEMSSKIPSQNWTGAELSGINDNDKIVGTLYYRPPPELLPPAQAFTYSVHNNRLIKLGIPAPYAKSYGAAINLFSVVAGTVADSNYTHAAWWNGTWHVLPCTNCVATAINFWSEIVGYSGNAGFLWTGGMTQLAGFPAAINDNGVIVGSACDSTNVNCGAAVWFNSGHTLAHLDALIDDDDPARGLVHFDKATAINSHGDIVAEGCWIGGAKKGKCRPFLLTPIEAMASR